MRSVLQASTPRRLFAAGISLLVLLGASGVFAGQRFGKAFVERFELNDAQVAKLERLRDFRIKSREEERTVRHELNAVVYADELDRDQLSRTAEKLSTLIRSNTIKDADLNREFFVSLNERQRQMWVSHETRDTKKRKAFQGDGKSEGDSAEQAEPKQ